MGLDNNRTSNSAHAIYLGCVHRAGDALCMWYLSQGEDQDWHREKPNLALIEYWESCDNNLIDFNQGKDRGQTYVVYHDLDDSDPSR